MINAMFESTTIPVLEQVVNFSQARHAVLAGNIANLDTPGYRVRDLSPDQFQARLKQAITARDQMGTSFASTTADMIRPDPISSAGNALEDLLYHDDSSGSLEMQITAIAKNQSQHNLALSIMTSQFRLLQAAISERA